MSIVNIFGIETIWWLFFQDFSKYDTGEWTGVGREIYNSQ